MSLTVTLNDIDYEIPDLRRTRAVYRALRTDESTATTYLDDPLAWIGLLEAVGEYLRDPDTVSAADLVHHFGLLIDEVAEEYLVGDLSGGDTG